MTNFESIEYSNWIITGCAFVVTLPTVGRQSEIYYPHNILPLLQTKLRNTRDTFTWRKFHICDRQRERPFSLSISPLIIPNIHVTWNPTQDNGFATICKVYTFLTSSAQVTWEEHVATPPPTSENALPAACASCTMHHVMNRYGKLRKRYGTLWSVVEELRNVTETLRSRYVTLRNCYGTYRFCPYDTECQSRHGVSCLKN